MLRDALLDVGLNHCLLREHVQIIVTPSIDRYPDDTSITTPSYQQDNLQPSPKKYKSDPKISNSFCNVFEMDKDTDCIMDLDTTVDYTIAQPEVVKAEKHTANEIVVPTASSTIPIPGNYARSQSLTFGTPEDTTILVSPNSTCQSQSSSLESCASYLSLPIESSVGQPSQLKRLPKIAVRSNDDVSGLFFSNVPYHSNASPQVTSESLTAITINEPCSSENRTSTTFHSLDTVFQTPADMTSKILTCNSDLRGSEANDHLGKSGGRLNPAESTSTGFMETLLPNITGIVLYAVTREHFTPQVRTIFNYWIKLAFLGSATSQHSTFYNM